MSGTALWRHRRALWIVGAGVLVALLALQTRRLRDEAIRELSRSLDVGLDVTQADVAGWRSSRQAHAAMLAHLFAEARDTGPLDARDARILRAATATEDDAELRVYDAEGRLRGAAERGGAGPSIEFSATAAAPSAAAGARRVATVVLRARPTDSTFHNLNPTSTVNRTARTSLLARAGDSVVIVATRSHGGRASLPRTMALGAVPPYVRAVLDGARQRGVGRGLFGQQVAYAAQPTLAPGWALVREMETAEYEARLRRPLLVQAVVVGALAVLLVIAVANGVRAAAARRERELARLRTDFVASASHELRTPLAQIQLFSELLRAGRLHGAADTDRALQVIASESQRLSTLVDNLLNFASLRRGAEDCEGETSDIAAVAAQVIADFTPFARERGTSLAARLDGPVMARIGPEAFRQVLINYLDNALKYGPAGQTISVRVWQTARTAAVSVEDQGEGIPAGERERVWQAFYRNERASASGLAGSGIGLAVVRDLVLQCGGTAWVEASAEGGARFVAELRRAPLHG